MCLVVSEGATVQWKRRHARKRTVTVYKQVTLVLHGKSKHVQTPYMDKRVPIGKDFEARGKLNPGHGGTITRGAIHVFLEPRVASNDPTVEATARVKDFIACDENGSAAFKRIHVSADQLRAISDRPLRVYDGDVWRDVTDDDIESLIPRALRRSQPAKQKTTKKKPTPRARKVVSRVRRRTT